jgi:hypothetical protein
VVVAVLDVLVLMDRQADQAVEHQATLILVVKLHQEAEQAVKEVMAEMAQ